MRLEPLPPFLPGVFPQESAASGAELPFGSLFQQASKENSGVRMTEQEDGSFLMGSTDEEGEGDPVVSEISLETQFLQAMVTSPSFGVDRLPDLSVTVLQEVRSLLGLPALASKEAPITMRVRFEKNAQGLVIVVQIKGEDLFAKAQDQKSVLQTRLSDTLDRSVTVRFVQMGEFDQVLEEAPSQSGFQQGGQQQDNPRQSQTSIETLSEGEESFFHV